MDSTKMIADLCAVIDRMNVIIQAQAMELAQYGGGGPRGGDRGGPAEIRQGHR